ncbi:hypothetical protein V3468_10800 [Flavobacterium oreochromis]|uniref:hypothetical protein n=1 Tax=Flavobacterium oreochromis TaxID=2906078 RepID=UPI00385EAF00
MERNLKKNVLILMITGIFVIATSQILNRFIELTDFTKGALIGIGVGFLLLSVTFGNLKSAK